MLARPKGFLAFSHLFRSGPAPVPVLGPADQTPLPTLPILLVDTETTGLDPRSDRIVQIAAIPWRGRDLDGEAMDTLVNPGRPIPPASTRIHGIADDDVARQAPYAEHHPALLEMMHGRVVLGHTIGFDIAVLTAEARRAGHHMGQPASLCLAEIAAAVLPRNQPVDLDALARRFEIEIEGRHTARADALAAGAVWQRLLPLLHDRGIHTWGAARRAAADAAHVLSVKRRSSW